jgi:putative oxidoreductase
MRLTTSVLAPLRPVARSFTGSTYVLLGFDALRAPGGRVEQAGPVLAAVRKAVPLPEDDELVVRANAAVQVLCGALLMAGRAPRLASLALAGSLIPTTLAGHSYWAIEDPDVRKIQRIQFHKNLAMIGGLLFSALDEPRTPPK